MKILCVVAAGVGLYFTFDNIWLVLGTLKDWLFHFHFAHWWAWGLWWLLCLTVLFPLFLLALWVVVMVIVAVVGGAFELVGRGLKNMKKQT